MKDNQPVIAVTGAGRMGVGITQVFACAGCRVELCDMKDRTGEEGREVLPATRKEIAANLQFLVSLGVFTQDRVEEILGNIGFHERDGAREILSKAHVVFEAVPEILNVKKEILMDISSRVPEDTLVASTTSTFLVETLASFIEKPERFLNTHWLNPAYLIPLVEVSAGRDTSDETLGRMFALLEFAGKVPVKCASSPGFIVPRIQALAMNEAARLVEEGVAAPEDIDRATRLGFGLRFAVLGLIEFIDWGGGDILYYAGSYLKDALKADRFTPPAIIRENMAAGRTGMKTGTGFYDFAGMDVETYRRETIKKFVDLLRHLGYLPNR